MQQTIQVIDRQFKKYCFVRRTVFLPIQSLILNREKEMK